MSQVHFKCLHALLRRNKLGTLIKVFVCLFFLHWLLSLVAGILLNCSSASVTRLIVQLKERSNDQEHVIAKLHKQLEEKTMEVKILNEMFSVVNEMIKSTEGKVKPSVEENGELMKDIKTQILRTARALKLLKKVENTSSSFFRRVYSTEKQALYARYSNGHVYETVPLNKLQPKQKMDSFHRHRDVDLRYAMRYATLSLTASKNYSKQHLKITNILFRYDELRGAKYKFEFIYNRTKFVSFDVMKRFLGYAVSSSIDEDDASGLLHIIVPVSNHTSQLEKFLEANENILKNQNIFLTFVVYEKVAIDQAVLSVTDILSRKSFNNYLILQKAVTFNRGRALHDGIMHWSRENTLVFLCDLDIKFTYPFINSCKRNSKSGVSVYMPAVFSLYNPQVVSKASLKSARKRNFTIHESTGNWRPSGFGMVCAYITDYLKAGGFDLNYSGWGGEDISLYKRFMKIGIDVIRAPDPDIFHMWHHKHCSSSLSKKQYKDCVGARLINEGSQKQLGMLLLSENKL